MDETQGLDSNSSPEQLHRALARAGRRLALKMENNILQLVTPAAVAHQPVITPENIHEVVVNREPFPHCVMSLMLQRTEEGASLWLQSGDTPAALRLREELKRAGVPPDHQESNSNCIHVRRDADITRVLKAMDAMRDIGDIDAATADDFKWRLHTACEQTLDAAAGRNRFLQTPPVDALLDQLGIMRSPSSRGGVD